MKIFKLIRIIQLTTQFCLIIPASYALSLEELQNSQIHAQNWLTKQTTINSLQPESQPLISTPLNLKPLNDLSFNESPIQLKNGKINLSADKLIRIIVYSGSSNLGGGATLHLSY
jgi:hypothetical protein